MIAPKNNKHTKSLLTVVFLLIIISSGFSQTNSKNYLLKEQQLKGSIEFIGLNISYEKRLGKSLTGYLEGGLAYAFSARNGLLSGSQYNFALAPFVSGSLRTYYNLKKRADNGRNVKNNSANYINLKAGYRFPTVIYKNMYESGVYGIELGWGIQRNIGDRFSFEAGPGVAFLYEPITHADAVSLIMNLKVGYILF